MSKTTNKQKLWSEEELEYLNEVAGKIPEEEIAKHLNRTTYGIIRKMARLKYNKFKRVIQKPYNKEDLQFIKDNVDKMTTEEMAIKLGRTIGSLTTKRNQLGVEKKVDFKDPLQDFQTPTKELAYLFGFTFADGCLYKYKTTHKNVPGRLVIGVKYTDGQILKRIADKISDNWKYRQYQYAVSKNPTFELVINSTPVYNFMYHDLEFKYKNEFFSSKIFDFLPENLHRYFWRGYFDGDGSVSLLDKGGNLSFSCNFCGPANLNWGKLSELLNNLDCNHSAAIHNNLNTDRRIRGSWSHLYICGHAAVRFLSYIYKDFSLDNIGFTRKFIRYVKYLERRAISPYYHDRMIKNSVLIGV